MKKFIGPERPVVQSLAHSIGTTLDGKVNERYQVFAVVQKGVTLMDARQDVAKLNSDWNSFAKQEGICMEDHDKYSHFITKWRFRVSG